ncbi:MAG: hypothetical protein NT090_14085 [Acidobacteria bacterium]|nr:hypothetical protein [Acidobacteriota bacterium]
MSTRFRLGREEVRHGSELGNHDVGVAAARLPVALVTAIKDVAASCVGTMLMGRAATAGPRNSM